jgi:hypothetical protein
MCSSFKDNPNLLKKIDWRTVRTQLFYKTEAPAFWYVAHQEITCELPFVRRRPGEDRTSVCAVGEDFDIKLLIRLLINSTLWKHGSPQLSILTDLVFKRRSEGSTKKRADQTRH